MNAKVKKTKMIGDDSSFRQQNFTSEIRVKIEEKLNQIKQYRSAHHQLQLATGISSKTFSKIFNGKTELSVELLEQLEPHLDGVLIELERIKCEELANQENPKIGLNLVLNTLNQIALEQKREPYGLIVVKDVLAAIRAGSSHPLKAKVMSIIEDTNTVVAEKGSNKPCRKKEFSTDEKYKIEQKLFRIKIYYSGQHQLHLATGVSSKTISKLLNRKKEITVLLWEKISPFLDDVLRDLENRRIETLSKKSVFIKEHGLIRSYRQGCRCKKCKATWNLYLKKIGLIQ